MGEGLKFSVSEVDTKGLGIFENLCAREKVAEAGELAMVILRYSQSDEVKDAVKQKFTAMLTSKYASLLYGGTEALQSEHLKLTFLYLNRAHKKLNISKDIPIFSEMAGRYVDENKTLLHYDRLYTLFQSVCNALRLKGDIVELGVYKGGSLKFISETLQALDAEKRLIGFDTFAGHVKVGEEDNKAHHWPGAFRSKESALSAVRDYLKNDKIELVAGDASETFPEYAKLSAGISLAHFDMDLYQPTADNLPIVWDLLPSGGIILLDDYGYTTCQGVKQAADEFLQKITATSFHLMTGQMIIVK